jgi:hypothetical protein
VKSNYFYDFIIFNGLLMYPLLGGHRPSLWITRKESGPLPTTRAQYGSVGANDCKCNRGQRLNVPSEAARDNKFLVTHPMNEQHCLTPAIARRCALTNVLKDYSHISASYSNAFDSLGLNEESLKSDAENISLR